MNKRLVSRFRQQKGFTLIELLVALAIVAVIGTALAATITQLIVVQAANKNHIEVVDQVQNALHYINRDAQMAWPSMIDTKNGSSYPVALYFSTHNLILEWVDYSNPDYNPNAYGTGLGNENYVVTYSLVNGALQRSETLDSGTPGQKNLPTMIVARDIDGTASNFSYNSTSKVLTVKLTSTIKGAKTAIETRTLQVQLRTTN